MDLIEQYKKEFNLSPQIYKKYDGHRMGQMIIINNSLSMYNSYKNLTKAEKENIVTTIEKHCFNKSIDVADKNGMSATWSNSLFIDIYNDICYKITGNFNQNLIQNKYNSYIDKIIDKDFDFATITNISPKDMCPELYIEYNKRLEASKNVTFTQKISHLYRCNRCKKNTCYIENVTLRSADEGTDLEITCATCGKKWNA